MKEGTAIEITQRFMQEVGVGDNYNMRYRHLQLMPKERLILQGENQYFILTDPPFQLKMYSKAGIFNLRDDRINEHQYLHRGITVLINQDSKRVLQVKILQIIPKQKENGF